MQINQLFKQAMDRYGIQGKELAELAGISTNHLSQFRSGNKWISPEVFVALLEAMDQLSPGSRRYFCELLAKEPLSTEENNDKRLEELIEAASEEQIDAVLMVIGRKWKRSSRNQPVSKEYDTSLNSAMAFRPA